MSIDSFRFIFNVEGGNTKQKQSRDKQTIVLENILWLVESEL